MKTLKIDLKTLQHGERLHSIWKSMINRCFNHQSFEFKNYGGRGITVCDEWKNDFLSFYEWAIGNGYKYIPTPCSANEKRFRNFLSLDRIDNNGNYEPNNCRWVDMKTQQNNRRKGKHPKGNSYASKETRQKINQIRMSVFVGEISPKLARKVVLKI